jgi:predicted transcriptional regulator
MKETLDQYIQEKPNKEEFHKYLCSLIDEKGMSDPEAYKRAGIDRRLWSKIMSDDDYRPSKRTVCMLIIALHLKYHESKHLIKSAGYILNRDIFDLVIRYCIQEGIYDPIQVDALLVEKNLKPLFSEQ